MDSEAAPTGLAQDWAECCHDVSKHWTAQLMIVNVTMMKGCWTKVEVLAAAAAERATEAPDCLGATELGHAAMELAAVAAAVATETNSKKTAWIGQSEHCLPSICHSVDVDKSHPLKMDQVVARRVSIVA